MSTVLDTLLQEFANYGESRARPFASPNIDRFLPRLRDALEELSEGRIAPTLEELQSDPAYWLTVVAKAYSDARLFGFSGDPTIAAHGFLVAFPDFGLDDPPTDEEYHLRVDSVGLSGVALSWTFPASLVTSSTSTTATLRSDIGFRGLWLQRSATKNNMPDEDGRATYETSRTEPPVDSNWTTVASWPDSGTGGLTVPTTYQDSTVPSPTANYRLLLIMPAEFTFPSMTHYWKMEESSGNRLDAVGSLPLALSGGTLGNAAGVHNNAASFIDNGAQLTASTVGAKTWSFWFKTGTAQDISLFTTGGDANVYANLTAGGNIAFGSEFAGDVELTAYTTGAWHHVVITDDGVTTKWYVDGDGKAPYSTDVRLGTSVIIQGGTILVDEASTFSIALTALQVKQLYNEGTGLFQ